MRIKIFKEEKEYRSHTDHSYDLYIVYFPVKIKPEHNIPILRVLTSYRGAGFFGYSSYAVTVGFEVENFPACKEEDLLIFAEDYLNGKYESVKIPSKFRKLNTAIEVDMGPTAPLNVIKMRELICSGCPLMSAGICQLCGCDIADKVKLAISSCPDNPPRWEAYSVAKKKVISSSLSTNTRNILYYVWCIDDKILSYHVDKLSRNMSLFNGQKIVTLIDPKKEHIDLFSRLGFSVFTGKNNNGEYPGESTYFTAMLGKLNKEEGITFYGHAKGMTYGFEEFNKGPVKKWVDFMYNECLFGYTKMEELLKTNVFAGANLRKVRRKNFKGVTKDTLVYPGTFFWFKNNDIFNLNWQYLGEYYGGVEDWPGTITEGKLMGAIDSKIEDNMNDMYSMEYWEKRGKSCVPCGQKK